MQDVAHGFLCRDDLALCIKLDAPILHSVDFAQSRHVVWVLVGATCSDYRHAAQMVRVSPDEGVKDREVGNSRCKSLLLLELCVGLFVGILAAQKRAKRRLASHENAAAHDKEVKATGNAEGWDVHEVEPCFSEEDIHNSPFCYRVAQSAFAYLTQ